MSNARPAWQTEDLEDEWVEFDELSGKNDEDDSLSNASSSISLTTPLPSHIQTSSDADDDTVRSSGPTYPVGTFVVHHEVPEAPLLPKTPGRAKKGNMRDMFTPLRLERMFEPPSPVVSPQNDVLDTRVLLGLSSDEIVETDLPNMRSFDGRRPSIGCQFTFSAPRTGILEANPDAEWAESTPCPPQPSASVAPPSSRPPLHLFRFQYDTFTKEHLSAMIDSIAVNTPGAGSTPSPTAPEYRLSKVSEAHSRDSSFSDLRSAKRVKLSPVSDFSSGSMQNANIIRPKSSTKDYIGESHSLMRQIRDARDFSTISSVASRPMASTHSVMSHERRPSSDSARNRIQISPPSPIPPSLSQSQNFDVLRRSTHATSVYQQEAPALMAQIKCDLRGQKRIFSGETDSSYVSTVREDSTIHSSHSWRSSVNEKENREEPFIQRRSFHRTPSSSSSTATTQTSHPSTAKLSNSLNGQAALSSAMSTLSIVEKNTLASSMIKLPPEVNIVTAYPMTSSLPSRHPSYSTATRAGPNEDLNRFVSSSTASGTTLTTGSAPSFVKHAGPTHIRTIAPSDVPALPERMGDMIFDRVMMRWVKSSARSQPDGMTDYPPDDTTTSEDPFEDIESLRDESRFREEDSVQFHRPDSLPQELSRVEEEQSEIEDEDEMELTSFETDDQSPKLVEIMTGVEDETLDSDDNPNDVVGDLSLPEFAASDSEDDIILPRLDEPAFASTSRPTYTTLETHYMQSTSVMLVATPVGREISSATPMKSALKSRSATPTSSTIKGHKYQTPMRKIGHRRSVSFSDGKRDGPIRGLGRNLGDESEADYSAEGAQLEPSARSKRIADMMNALEGSDSDLDEDSPSKTYSTGGKPEEIQPLTTRASNAIGVPERSRVFSRSRTYKASPGVNATFLTECSFGVAHDKLVQVITDVEPFEPYWEDLNTVDLSGKNIESAARLKEFLPKLDALNMNINQLSWLSGVPGTVRTLSVASNCLTGVTSFHHLLNLESLDISNNDIDSLRQLACLRHLRELKADSNKISSLAGLEHLDGLVKLSLQGNMIRSVDVAQYRWTRLEMLNLSCNGLHMIQNIGSLSSLIALNLDSNAVESFDVTKAMNKLRILRASGNRLAKINVANLTSLRTLYLDNNNLNDLGKIERLTKLENLSVRNQGGRKLNLLTRDVRDAKRLYLSGNPIGNGFLNEACYNLVYVELAACRLTDLPSDLRKLIPNVRVLNLNYNFLEDVGPLEGLSRLKKLTVIGSRLQGTKGLIRLLKGMPDVEMLDFRMNPCTLGWYLPLLVKDVPGALQPSERKGSGGGGRTAGWEELDCKFRRDLPDEIYIGRLAYRGLVMETCPRVRMLDGVEVTEKEKMKATKLLSGILKGRGGR